MLLFLWRLLLNPQEVIRHFTAVQFFGDSGACRTAKCATVALLITRLSSLAPLLHVKGKTCHIDALAHGALRFGPVVPWAFQDLSLSGLYAVFLGIVFPQAEVQLGVSPCCTSRADAASDLPARETSVHL